MKRLILLLSLLGTLFAVAGCGDGMVDNRRARMHRAELIMEDDWKQFNDDIDLLLLNDRPLRTSRYVRD